MTLSMVAKTLWFKHTKFERKLQMGKQIKSLLKNHERKYNFILHEASLWCEDSILYQWMPYGVLGPSSAKSNFDIVYYG